MKPAEKVQAWKCGRCFNLFPFNEHGKRFAEACCTCGVEGCDQPAGGNRLGGNRCDLHIAEEELATCRTRKIDAEKWLERAEKRVATVKMNAASRREAKKR